MRPTGSGDKVGGAGVGACVGPHGRGEFASVTILLVPRGRRREMATEGTGSATSPAGKSIRQLVAEMSAKELWGLIVIVAGIVAGAFMLGDWYRGKGAALELATVRLEDQKQVAKAEGDLGELKGNLATTEELNR